MIPQESFLVVLVKMIDLIPTPPSEPASRGRRVRHIELIDHVTAVLEEALAVVAGDREEGNLPVHVDTFNRPPVKGSEQDRCISNAGSSPSGSKPSIPSG